MYQEHHLYKLLAQDETWLIETRRRIHQNPELSEGEHETQKFIEDVLDSLGIQHEKIADTGVLAVVTGKGGTGNVVGIRADIDALPIQEPEFKPYASKNKGVMHACGHDAHTTILLGTLKYLKEHESQWGGTVKGFFQPAEETVGGADRMVQEGCMDNPKVDYVIGLHVMPYLEVGEIETREGKLNAASDSFKIAVRGKAAHGAYPEKGVDAINIAAQVVTGINGIMSRQISPLNQAVITVGQIHGGVKNNILCDEVVLSGMMRTTDEVTRKDLKQRVERLAVAISEGNGGHAEVSFREGYQALINDIPVARKVKALAASVLGNEHVYEKEAPSLGVEDFSFFLDRAPGAFYHLGCGNQSKEISSALHTEQFEIDETCLTVGVFLQSLITLDLLMRGDMK